MDAPNGRTGRPEVDALLDAADAEKRVLGQVTAVNRAEAVVRRSRQDDLLAEQKAAYRRVSAARGALTRARNDGNADKIGAAEQRMRQRQREADATDRRVLAESHAIVGAAGDAFDAQVGRMRRAWAAGDAAIDALTRPADDGQERRRSPHPESLRERRRRGR